MNTINRSEIPAIGSPVAAGFYAGLINIEGQHHAVIVSPKAQGEFAGIEWGEYGKSIPATSCFDGAQNTTAMAEAGNDMATKILQMGIDGITGWYIPSRDELEICYRNLKPTPHDNYCSFRDGDNASSIPVGYPYTKQSPAQTPAEPFQTPAPEAFESQWYWSSTQFSAYHAYIQTFGAGHQFHCHKGNGGHVRAVRRLLVIE